MATVVLDPGHGGQDRVGGSSPNNATGPTGLLEKDLTLQVCKLTQTILQERGHRAILTRASDRNLGLKDRARLARQTAAEVFVSVHFNGWPDPNTQGTETHIHRRAGGASRELAKEIQTALVQATALRDRGVKDQYTFGVLAPEQHNAATAACLAEISFLTNPAEEARLKRADYVHRVAQALADGCEAFLNSVADAERSSLALPMPAVADAGSEDIIEDGVALYAARPELESAVDRAARSAERISSALPPRLSIDELDAEISRADAADDLSRLEELSIYFEATGDPPAPFAHDVAASSLLVEGADARGDLAMKLANKLSRAIRSGKYKRRLRSGYKGPILVSEGDSWFQYPLLLKDVIDHLIDDYAVYSLDAAGDSMADIAKQDEYEAAIRREGAKVFLISAGGNDLVGSGDLDLVLARFPVGGDIAKMFDTEAFKQRIGQLRTSYDQMYQRLLSTFPDLAIISHCYDYARPRADGTWLGPPLTRLGVPLATQPRVVVELIDQFARVQRDLSVKYAGRIHFVDCRNVVISDWKDELHPTNPGFKRVGLRFKQAVQAASGVQVDENRADARSASTAGRACIRVTRNGAFLEEQGQPLAALLAELTAGDAKLLHLHVHGGLTERENGLAIAERLSRDDALGASTRRQIFFVWSSGVFEVLQANFLEILEKAFLLRLLRHVAKWVAERVDYLDDGVRAAPTKAAAIDQDLARLDALFGGRTTSFESIDPEPFAQFGGPPSEGADDASSLEAAIMADGAIAAVTEALEAEIARPSSARASLGRGLADAEREAAWLLSALDEEPRRQLMATIESGTRGGATFLALKAVAIGRAVIRRFARGRAHGLWPTVVEELARALFVENLGGAIWGAMKGDGSDLFRAGGDGKTIIDEIVKAREAAGAKPFEVAISAHSAGAVLACHLLQYAAREPGLANVQWNVVFLAPACDYELFAQTLSRAEPLIGRFRMFTMTDEAERSDPVLGVFNPRLAPLYPRSLLYLVSGLFEQGEIDDPILGMARFHGVDAGRRYDEDEKTALVQVNRYLFDPVAPARVVLTPTALDAPIGFRSLSRAHVAFDRDKETLASVSEILAGGGRTVQEVAAARAIDAVARTSVVRELPCAPVGGRDPKTEAMDHLEGNRVLDGVLPFSARQSTKERAYLKEAAHALKDGALRAADIDVTRALAGTLPPSSFERCTVADLVDSESVRDQLEGFAAAGVGFFKGTPEFVSKALAERLGAGADGEVSRVLKNGDEVLLETQRIIVSLDPDMSAERRQAFMDANALAELREFPGLSGRTFHCVMVSETKEKTATDACRELMSHSGVNYAQPDYVRHIGSRTLPSDTLLANQWHHERVSSKGGWSAGVTGKGAKLAVIDNGFDTRHPDLLFDTAHSGWFDAPGGSADAVFVRGLEMPDRDHGTACAGMAAAAQTLGRGVGLAYEANLRGVACLPDQVGTQTTLIRALLFAADPTIEDPSIESGSGADVIVCSLGPSRAPRWVADVVLKDVLESISARGRGGKGIPIFWAVTNGRHPIRLDDVCASTFVMAVGRSTQSDTDDGSGYGPELDFLAPGVDVFIPSSGGAYVKTTGTSFAAPCAAGVGALVIQVAPHLTAAQVRLVLRKSCDPVGVHPYLNKRNNYFGFGRVNAARAISIAKQM